MNKKVYKMKRSSIAVKLKDKRLLFSMILVSLPHSLMAWKVTKDKGEEYLNLKQVNTLADNVGLIFLTLMTLGGVIAVAIGIKKLAFEEKGQSQENNHVRGISFIAGGALWIVLMVFIGWVTGVNITIDE
jgi:hypothetical protein